MRKKVNIYQTVWETTLIYRINELEEMIDRPMPPQVQKRIYDLLKLNRYLLDVLTGAYKKKWLNMDYKNYYYTDGALY